jgi:cytoskeletal protein CcmA (bactofilin family)
MEASAQREAAGVDVSVIGAGITVTGNIEASVDLQIQGKVTGDVHCATLLLGEGSEIRGNVVADRVRVAGAVDGSIETKDLAIETSARVTGDITYSRIRIANGGIVHGQMNYRKGEEEAGEGAHLRLVEQEKAAEKPKAVYIE